MSSRTTKKKSTSKKGYKAKRIKTPARLKKTPFNDRQIEQARNKIVQRFILMRVELGLSYPAASKLIGIKSHAHLVQIEQRKEKPSLETIALMSMILTMREQELQEIRWKYCEKH